MRGTFRTVKVGTKYGYSLNGASSEEGYYFISSIGTIS